MAGPRASNDSAIGLDSDPAIIETLRLHDDLPLQPSRHRRPHSCPACTSRPARLLYLAILVVLAFTYALLPQGNDNGGASTDTTMSYAIPPSGVQLADLDPELLPRPAGADGEPERRMLIVGAVNGRVSDLHALLHSVAFSNTSDTLLLTGNFLPSLRRPSMSIAESLFYSQPRSASSVLAAINALNATSVLGPHEAHLLTHLTAGKPDSSAKEALSEASTPSSSKNAASRPPADPTLEKQNENAKENTLASLQTLTHLPLLLRLGHLSGPTSPLTILSHGGLVPGIALESQTASDSFALARGRGYVQQVYGADDIGVPHLEGWRVVGPGAGRQGRKGGKGDENEVRGRRWWEVWGEVQEEVKAVGMGMGALEGLEVAGGKGESVGAGVGTGVALGVVEGVRVVYGGTRESGYDGEEGGNGLEEVRKEKWSVGLGGGCGVERAGRGAKLTGLLISGDGREEVVQVFCEKRD